jgi:hypothetical protein
VSFLTDRVPGGFAVRRVDAVFEHGSDGVLASVPWFSRAFRVGGKVRLMDARTRLGVAGIGAWLVAKAVWFPARILDLTVSAALGSWGNRMRYYNLFCRQLWVVFERND